MKRVSCLGLVVGLFAVVQVASMGTAAAAVPAAEQQFVDLINQERAERGLSTLAVHPDVRTVARNWSDEMIADGKGCGASLSHNPDYKTQVPQGWTRVAENVACGQTVGQLHDLLMASSGHRANILGDFNQIGVGVSIDGGGTMWVTQNFMQHPAAVPGDGGGGPGGTVPVLSVADAAGPEGDSRGAKLNFIVSLSSASTQTVTVAYATAPGTADGTDYKSKAGTVTIQAGKTSAKVSVPLKSDTRPEPDERFTLTLSNATNASIGDGVATGTIVNDD